MAGGQPAGDGSSLDSGPDRVTKLSWGTKKRGLKEGEPILIQHSEHLWLSAGGPPGNQK